MQERARSRATAKPPPSRMIIHIPQPASVPTEQLDQLGLVKTPLSWPASGLRGRKYIDEISGIDSMGIWECSPGRWQRTIAQEEFAHFLKGSATVPSRMRRSDRHPSGGLDLVPGQLKWRVGNRGRPPQGLCDHRPAHSGRSIQGLDEAHVSTVAWNA